MCLYVRPLTEAEQAEVERLARSSDAVTYRHARLVLLSAQGHRVPQLVREIGLCERQIRKLLHAFNDQGVAALPHGKAPGSPPRCDAVARAALVELLRRSPTEFGIESATWTGADVAAVAATQGLPPYVAADRPARDPAGGAALAASQALVPQGT